MLTGVVFTPSLTHPQKDILLTGFNCILPEISMMYMSFSIPTRVAKVAGLSPGSVGKFQETSHAVLIR